MLRHCIWPQHVFSLAWLNGSKNGADHTAKADGRIPKDVVDGIDLFAPARAQRPDDFTNVKALLCDDDLTETILERCKEYERVEGFIPVKNLAVVVGSEGFTEEEIKEMMETMEEEEPIK